MYHSPRVGPGDYSPMYTSQQRRVTSPVLGRNTTKTTHTRCVGTTSDLFEAYQDESWKYSTRMLISMCWRGLFEAEHMHRFHVVEAYRDGLRYLSSLQLTSLQAINEIQSLAEEVSHAVQQTHFIEAKRDRTQRLHSVLSVGTITMLPCEEEEELNKPVLVDEAVEVKLGEFLVELRDSTTQCLAVECNESSTQCVQEIPILFRPAGTQTILHRTLSKQVHAATHTIDSSTQTVENIIPQPASLLHRPVSFVRSPMDGRPHTPPFEEELTARKQLEDENRVLAQKISTFEKETKNHMIAVECFQQECHQLTVELEHLQNKYDEATSQHHETEAQLHGEIVSQREYIFSLKRELLELSETLGKQGDMQMMNEIKVTKLREESDDLSSKCHTLEQELSQCKKRVKSQEEEMLILIQKSAKCQEVCEHQQHLLAKKSEDVKRLSNRCQQYQLAINVQNEFFHQAQSQLSTFWKEHVQSFEQQQQNHSNRNVVLPQSALTHFESLKVQIQLVEQRCAAQVSQLQTELDRHAAIETSVTPSPLGFVAPHSVSTSSVGTDPDPLRSDVHISVDESCQSDLIVVCHTSSNTETEEPKVKLITVESGVSVQEHEELIRQHDTLLSKLNQSQALVQVKEKEIDKLVNDAIVQQREMARLSRTVSGYVTWKGGDHSATSLLMDELDEMKTKFENALMHSKVVEGKLTKKVEECDHLQFKLGQLEGNLENVKKELIISQGKKKEFQFTYLPLYDLEKVQTTHTSATANSHEDGQNFSRGIQTKPKPLETNIMFVCDKFPDTHVLLNREVVAAHTLSQLEEERQQYLSENYALRQSLHDVKQKCHKSESEVDRAHREIEELKFFQGRDNKSHDAYKQPLPQDTKLPNHQVEMLEADLAEANEKIFTLEVKLRKQTLNRQTSGHHEKLEADLAEANEMILALEGKLNDAQHQHNKQNLSRQSTDTQHVQMLEADLAAANDKVIDLQRKLSDAQHLLNKQNLSRQSTADTHHVQMLEADLGAANDKVIDLERKLNDAETLFRRQKLLHEQLSKKSSKDNEDLRQALKTAEESINRQLMHLTQSSSVTKDSGHGTEHIEHEIKELFNVFSKLDRQAVEGVQISELQQQLILSRQENNNLKGVVSDVDQKARKMNLQLLDLKQSAQQGEIQREKDLQEINFLRLEIERREADKRLPCIACRQKDFALQEEREQLESILCSNREMEIMNQDLLKTIRELSASTQQAGTAQRTLANYMMSSYEEKVSLQSEARRCQMLDDLTKKLKRDKRQGVEIQYLLWEYLTGIQSLFLFDYGNLIRSFQAHVTNMVRTREKKTQLFENNRRPRAVGINRSVQAFVGIPMVSESTQFDEERTRTTCNTEIQTISDVPEIRWIQTSIPESQYTALSAELIATRKQMLEIQKENEMLRDGLDILEAQLNMRRIPSTSMEDVPSSGVPQFRSPPDSPPSPRTPRQYQHGGLKLQSGRAVGRSPSKTPKWM